MRSESGCKIMIKYQVFKPLKRKAIKQQLTGTPILTYLRTELPPS